MLNSVLYTNSKLHKIGFKTDDLCSFCKAEPETLYHLFYQCSYAKWFWSEFQGYWHQISNQQVHLSLQDVLFRILSKPCTLLNLLNYIKVLCPARSRTRTARSGVKRTNHEATAPPTKIELKLPLNIMKRKQDQKERLFKRKVGTTPNLIYVVFPFFC